MNGRPRRKPQRGKKEPKGASMLSGIFVIALAIVAIIAAYQISWGIMYEDGEKIDEVTFQNSDDDSKVHIQHLEVMISSVGLIIGGAIISISNLLEEIEVIGKPLARLMSYGSEKALIIPSALLIFIGAEYIGYFISSTHQSMILYDTTVTSIYPSPFIFLGIGSFILLYIFRKSKKEIDSMVFDQVIKKNKVKKVKKIKKTPVMDERRRF